VEPGPGQGPLIEYFAATFKTRTRSEWESFLAKIDVCWAPVRTLKDGLDDPQTRARRMVVEDPQDNRHIGPAIKFRNDPAAPRLELPRYQPDQKVAPRWRER
jgi:crotonobetainyl-CoA:carnitine CoA-transferase CaiB-like acyl-CoA transferase